MDETDFFINLNFNHKLKETDIGNIDLKSPLAQQIENQEKKSSGWNFVKNNTMTLFFYKTGEMNGSSYGKIPLRSSAILNIENNDKYCFLWLMLAKLHTCNNSNPNRVSNYRQNFDELIFEGFNFSNGNKCSDVHNFLLTK